MLRFKRDLGENKNRYSSEVYLTESAFYIGTEKWINDILKEKLMNRIDEDIDGMLIFYLFIKFLVVRFQNTDRADIYKYIEEYFEEDLEDFIKRNFIEE